MVALTMLVGCAGTKRNAANLSNTEIDERQRMDQALNLALQAAKTKDPDEAIKLYQRSVQTYDQIANVWNNLGVTLMGQGRRQEADDAFGRASELAPNDPRPAYNRGLIRFQAKYPAESRVFFVAALERDPNYLPALRGIIEADITSRAMSDETLDYIRRALFNERDKRWRERFELHKSRVEAYLEDQREQAEAKLGASNALNRSVGGFGK